MPHFLQPSPSQSLYSYIISMASVFVTRSKGHLHPRFVQTRFFLCVLVQSRKGLGCSCETEWRWNLQNPLLSFDWLSSSAETVPLVKLTAEEVSWWRMGKDLYVYSEDVEKPSAYCGKELVLAVKWSARPQLRYCSQQSLSYSGRTASFNWACSRSP